MDSKELQESYGPSVHFAVDSKSGTVNYAHKDERVHRNSYDLVREFMEKFGHPVFDEPQLIADADWEEMRVELIREEVKELEDAVASRDLVGIADALGDLEYVVNGMALGCGIDLPAVVREIHRSNMTKLGQDGKPIWREDGKVLKGPGYEEPDLEKVLYG